MESEVIANRGQRLEFVSDAVDFLFYTILKNMKILGTKAMDYHIVVTITGSKGYGKCLPVEPLRIGNPALLVSLIGSVHFLLIVDLRVDQDQVGLDSD
jgi:hypothetical protein